MSIEEKKSWNNKLVITSTILSIVIASTGLYSFIKDNKTCSQIDGIWTMTFTVKKSSYNPYVNDVYVYDIYVSQTESKIKGNGEQTFYNGKYARKHFKLDWNEVDISDKITIPYTLHGSRETSGIMTLEIDPNNNKHLTGSFAGGAADVTGTVEIRVK